MAELTIESIQQVVSHEISGLRQEMQQEFSNVRAEMRHELTNVRSDMADGFDQVLTTVQSIHDVDQDEFVGIQGRLRNHNERIAKLERLNNLRS